MFELDIDIPTPDGTMNTFVVHPEEGGPHPLVMFWMDAPGKREELHEMARRLAAPGYCVLLPNLYYRRTRDWWLRERVEPHMTHMFELMATMNRATAVCDARAMLAYGQTLPAADTTRLGAVGYCMSGPLVIWAADALPQRMGCIASIHGANMVTDAEDSPHRVAARLRCEAYYACAETDKWAPREHIEALGASLAAGGAPHRIEWYPGTEHGFVFPQRAVYQREGAERHWERLYALLDRNLR